MNPDAEGSNPFSPSVALQSASRDFTRKWYSEAVVKPIRNTPRMVPHCPSTGTPGFYYWSGQWKGWEDPEVYRLNLYPYQVGCGTRCRIYQVPRRALYPGSRTR